MKITEDLDVDRITDVEWNKQAFKTLVAHEKTKELVEALVTNRLAAEKSTDVIHGKGNGLIILLHGGQVLVRHLQPKEWQRLPKSPCIV